MRTIVLLLAFAGSASAIRTWTDGNRTFEGFLEDAPVEDGFCDPSVKQLSGYFKINGTHNANYFFWFFESRSNPATDPTMIWLTGGPGCSSQLALLAENGPCSVNKDLSTTLNNHSWNSNANIMWVDQPTGVGFSYGDDVDYLHDEAGVGTNMNAFVREFMGAHPEYAKNEFFVFGESYGGHYVPAVSHAIFAANQQGDAPKVNLAGFGVGNGLTNPEVQYKWYANMAFNNTYGIKCVTEKVYEQMQQATPSCIQMIEQCQTDTSVCAKAQTQCNNALIGPYEQTGLNPYDIRRPCGSNPLCYDFSSVTTFLNSQRVLDALHISKESAKWESCNYKVNGMFASDWMKGMEANVPPMIEGGVRALIYAGDVDFICNWMGNKAWTLALNWTHQSDFNKAPDHDWNVNGAKAGTARTAGDNALTFLQINNAGHMVPMDQSEAALEMLRTFLSGGTF